MHWLKAKAQHDRWQEEKELILSEMDWVRQYFLSKAGEWTQLAVASNCAEQHQGLTSHALKTVNMWKQLVEYMITRFQSVKIDEGERLQERTS